VTAGGCTPLTLAEKVAATCARALLICSACTRTAPPRMKGYTHEEAGLTQCKSII